MKNFVKYVLYTHLIVILFSSCSFLVLEHYYSPSAEKESLKIKENYGSHAFRISGPANRLTIETEIYKMDISVLDYDMNLISFGLLYFPIVPFPFDWIPSKSSFADSSEIRIALEITVYDVRTKWNFDSVEIVFPGSISNLHPDSIRIYGKPIDLKSKQFLLKKQKTNIYIYFKAKNTQLQSFNFNPGNIELYEEKTHFPLISFSKVKGWSLEMAP